jgi:hypothetical protein
MKTINKTLALLFAATMILNSCRKEETPAPENPATPTGGDNYTSLSSFYAQNGVPMQHFTINGATGGSFTTPKGTVVTIPGNIFMDQSGNPVVGNVTIEFKDIYDKSDMLLSKMPPMLSNGYPLKSGGEFFIRAKSGGASLLLNGSNLITVQQPMNSWAPDPNMMGFGLSPADTAGWVQDSSFSVLDSGSSNYIYSMYTFQSPADSGSWGNSDNPTYFGSYSQTQLTFSPTNNPTGSAPDVYLLFTGINSMVHVYAGTPYMYAPIGLSCTMVAVGVGSNKKLYSSFVPITITANQTVNFTMAEQTTAAFKAQLNTYNH